MWDLSDDGNIKRDNEYGLILDPDRNDGKFILKLLNNYNSGAVVLWENLNDELFIVQILKKQNKTLKPL